MWQTVENSIQRWQMRGRRAVGRMAVSPLLLEMERILVFPESLMGMRKSLLQGRLCPVAGS